jgi:hypothetical protein
MLSYIVLEMADLVMCVRATVEPSKEGRPPALSTFVLSNSLTYVLSVSVSICLSSHLYARYDLTKRQTTPNNDLDKGALPCLYYMPSLVDKLYLGHHR